MFRLVYHGVQISGLPNMTRHSERACVHTRMVVVSVSLSVGLSVSLSVSVCLFLSQSLGPALCVSLSVWVYVSVSLSLSPSLYLCQYHCFSLVFHRGAQGDGSKLTDRAQNADSRRQTQIFADSLHVLEIQAC